MGILDFGSEDSKNAAYTEMNPKQRQRLKQLWDKASGILGRNGNWGADYAKVFGEAAKPGIAGVDAAMGNLTSLMENPLAGQEGILARLGKMGNVNALTKDNQASLSTLAGLMDPSAQIKAQSQSLQSSLGDMFRTELNPAITGNSIAAGGFGGGRQGVAQSNAVGELAQAFQSGLGTITANANAQAASAATGYSDILSGIQASAQSANALSSDIITGGNQLSLNASQLMPSLAESRLSLGTAQADARISALERLKGILGDPTSYTRSWGDADNWSFGVG